MDDFETFKATREKMDPSTRKFSHRQWEKAYAAYRSSRERVNESTSPAKAGRGAKRRKRPGKTGVAHGGGGRGMTGNLRDEVRQNSAYGDLRLIVDLLAWIAIGLIVLTAAVKLVYYTNANAALVAVLVAASQVLGVILLRLLAHVVIDIPDIALHTALSPKRKSSGDEARDE